MENKDYIIIAGVYASRAEASADLKELEHLEAHEKISNLSAAVITKDETGRLKLHQATSEGKNAAAAGLLVGAVPAIVLAAVFPPAGLALLGFAAVTGTSFAAVLGAVGHFRGGLSRQAVNEVASMLEEGDSALIAVAENKQEERLENSLTRATRHVQHDLDKGDFEKASAELAKELSKVDADS